MYWILLVSSTETCFQRVKLTDVRVVHLIAALGPSAVAKDFPSHYFFFGMFR